MSRSRLQEKFMEELAATFRATQARIERRLADDTHANAPAIVEDELRGLYHGLLVTFDGASALANEGLVSIVDDDGVAFDRFLHEICFRYWPARRDTGAATDRDRV
jgi:hypothetical protein